MAWIGPAVAIGSALLQADAASGAAGQASGASNAATQAQMQMFQTQNDQQAPYRQAGYNALNEISRGFGIGGTTAGESRYNLQDFIDNQYRVNPSIEPWRARTDAGTQFAKYNAGEASTDTVSKWPGFRDLTSKPSANGIPEGYFSHQFGANDLKTSLAPNYQFQLEQGQGAARNAGNLQTGLISGNTMKGLEDYTQNYASGAYQNAFNNYTANQSNIFNRLSTIAGLGSAANSQSSSLAGQLAPSIAGTMQSAGASQAAGTVGSANALAGGTGNALGWYQLGNMMNANSGFDINDPNLVYQN